MAKEKEIYKCIKKNKFEGATYSELLSKFPQLESEFENVLARLQRKTKIIRSLEERDGERIYIDVKQMVAYMFDYLHRHPELAEGSSEEEVVDEAEPVVEVEE